MSAEEIAAFAEECARKYNPSSVAPFPYENVLSAFRDLEIHFVDLEDDEASGVTLFDGGKISILINSTKPETRQHFTLGHELGHYFLHEALVRKWEMVVDRDPYLDGPNMLYRADDLIKTEYEIEANIFAATLLMPEQLVRKAWEATESVEECAEIFKVSVIAMSIRLTKLGLVKE
jgi:Zn-dependent peptidase ImmA (M78 family)